MKNVLFTDFYGTIVNQIGENRYYDITPNLKVWDAIKTIKPDYLFILENEPAFDKNGMRDNDFKYEYFKRSIVKYLNLPDTFIEFNYCPFSDNNNEFKKPNVGMYARMLWKYVGCDYNAPFDDPLAQCLVIGHEQDMIVAKHIGCKYMTTEQFIAAMSK